MGKIVWETDFMKALAAAKSNHKLLFVAFTKPGCKACAEMESTTLSESNVQDYMKDNFISLQFKPGTNPEKYLRFNVAETPTYIILNLNGREVKRKTGYLSSDEFISELDNARSGV